MKYKYFVVSFFLFLIFTNCEKKDSFENSSHDAQIIEFVSDKCYCCWGWVIEAGGLTIKTEEIPGLRIPEDIENLPINGTIKIGDKLQDCPDGMFDYYEVIRFKQND